MTQPRRHASLRILALTAIALLLSIVAPAAARAALEVSPDAVNIGTIAPGDVASYDITLQNTGAAPITINDISLDGDGVFGIGSWPGTLAAGASATVTITFEPNGDGNYRADIIVNSSAGSDTVGVTGTAYASGALGGPSDPIDIGDVRVGERVEFEIWLDNWGTGTLTVNPPVFSDPQFSFGTFFDFAIDLWPFETYPFKVALTPTRIGTINATVTYTSSGGTVVVPVTARATGPALTATPASASFADTADGAARSLNLDIASVGDATAQIGSVTIENAGTNPAAGQFTVTQSLSSLAVGAHGTLGVTFNPSGTGMRTAQVRVRDTDGRTLLTVPVSGRSTGAELSVTDQLAFGSVRLGETATRTLTLTNVGNEPLTFASVQANPAVYTFDGDTSPLAPGASRVVSVRFSPTTTGSQPGTLRLETNAVLARTVSLTGSGSVALLSVHQPLSTGTERPSDVALADFNEDGKLDIAIAYASNGGLEVAPGNGDGTFGARVGLGNGSAGATGLATGDLNSDGFTDLVSVHPNLTRVLYGRGDLTFAITAFNSQTGNEPVIADLNEDGNPEIVLVRSQATTVPVLVGTGAGPGGPLFSSITLANAPSPGATAVTAADIDRDGDVDLITGGGLANQIVVNRNRGTGIMNARLGDLQRITATSPLALGVGNFTADGRPDLVTGRQLLPGLASTLGDPITSGQPGEALAIADLNADGNDDQITTSHTDDAIHISLGDGAGGLTDQADVLTTTSGGAQPADLATGDLNGDGRMDVVAAKGGLQVDVLLGVGSAAVDGTGKAVITEARFGNDGYVQVTNGSRTAALRLDGWQLRFPGGREVTFGAGTRVPPRGTAVATTVSWSLASLARGPVGMPSTATGVALVDPRGTVVDAAGLTSAPSTLREGAGLPEVSFRGQGAFVRRSVNGAPQDTGDNAGDFQALDNGAQDGDATVLGAPRPDRWNAPTDRNDILQSSLFNPAVSQSAAPNRERVGDTLVIRRTLTNCSGGLVTGACVNADPSAAAVVVTKLRFRVTDLSTIGTSTAALLKVVATAPGGPAIGLDLDAPSPASGGGINATLSPSTALPSGGLAPGDSITIAFTLKIERGGSFRFGYTTEDDLIPAPKRTAPAAAADEVPAALPTPELVQGTAPAPPAVPTAAAAAPATKAPAATKKPAAKTKCVSRKQMARLKGKARKRAKLCRAKTATKKPASAKR